LLVPDILELREDDAILIFFFLGTLVDAYGSEVAQEGVEVTLVPQMQVELGLRGKKLDIDFFLWSGAHFPKKRE